MRIFTNKKPKESTRCVLKITKLKVLKVKNPGEMLLHVVVCAQAEHGSDHGHIVVDDLLQELKPVLRLGDAFV